MKNARKSLWLDKAIPEFLNGFVFLSWKYIIKIKKKTCRASSLLQRIKWA